MFLSEDLLIKENPLYYIIKHNDAPIHGRWDIDPEVPVMQCSACRWLFEYYAGLEEEWNYCPHCGAKMDEEEE